MATPTIPPLRYQKGTNGVAISRGSGAFNRPLSELSPMAIRRNSPSFPQSKVSTFKTESSPATSSPFGSTSLNSPHTFWQQRDAPSPTRENQNPVDLLSPTKRSSIENLKKASRVKNSSMFAKEQQNNYDPARPSILDGRPLGSVLQGNAFGGRASDSFRHSIHEKDTSKTSSIPIANERLSPSKLNVSPAKSSLSKKTGANMRYSGFDPGSGIWEDEDDQERKLPEGRSLHRHAKSVTFDKAPPQINEYEMTTPDPSSVASGSREGSYDSYDDEEEENEYSYERGSSVDHDDSFDASLEDTEKTPVVLPEDWRFMSPAIANTQLAEHEEDVFDDDVGSPAPTAEPGTKNIRPHQVSVNSVDSNGHPRPLPPLPQALAVNKNHVGTRNSLSGTIERMSSGQRTLASPPPAASLSKSDLRRMSRDSLSLEDRLQLMMLNGNQKNSQREVPKDSSPFRGDLSHQFNEDSILSTGTVPASNSPLRLNRATILEQLQESRMDDCSQAVDEVSRSSSSVYDPDTPIPSLEDPTLKHDQDIEIKEEEVDDDDLYAIPDMYSRLSDDVSEDEHEASYESVEQPELATNNVNMSAGNETPRATSPAQVTEQGKFARERMSLPDFDDFGDNSSFNIGLSEYLTPPSDSENQKPLPDTPVEMPKEQPTYEPIQRPRTPEEILEPPKLSFSGDESSAEPGTPSSVIRHPITVTPEFYLPEEKATGEALSFEPKGLVVSEDMEHDSQPLDQKVEAPQLEQVQQAALQKTATEKRVSSLVQLKIPHGDSDEGLGSLELEKEFDRVVEAQKVAFELSLQQLYHPFHGRFPSGEHPSTTSSTGRAPDSVEHLSSLDGARAKIAQTLLMPPPLVPNRGSFANKNYFRQRGYLMRQNTKVVVASERVLHEDHAPTLGPKPEPAEATEQIIEPNEIRPSSRKASQPSWTAEPWNGKSRRRSIRIGGEKATARRKPVEGPAPPLPSQASNVQENLGAVAEDEFAEEEAEDFEEGVERGRLFAKVVGVKDLQLPLPSDERAHFALTLDNGIHCVTTAWLDLSRNAPIGQEFELVVLNDLEFQLTLQMKLEEPKIERPASPSKPAVSPKKQGAFGRLFGSPKKKKESDHGVSQEVKRPVSPPSAYELVQGLVAKDGSFARAYVSLSEHERQAYGRPYHVDVKCFNEWAMEEVSAGSSRSKKGVHLQHRPPYEIGKLELQLLYIPKPKGAKDEEMPKSMNSALRTLKEAEEKTRQQANIKNFEGYLSQQGGDCPYWRRRFFKLVGSKLTAYHESTLQPRATINLNKANKLIDDKSSLMQKETSTKGGGRRKSAFADDEEGYMFVEEGFRIRFANGEVIDFYADSAALKEEWMQALVQVVGKNVSSSSSSVKGWAEMVLKREKSMRAKSQVEASMKKVNREVRRHEQTTTHVSQQAAFAHTSSIPLPTTNAPQPSRPSGHSRTESYQAGAGSRSQASSPVKSKVSPAERRAKARSMAF